MTILDPEVEVELPDPTITVADTLRLAVQAIQERGWTTGAMENAEGQVCALGAIAVGLGYSPFLMENDNTGTAYRLFKPDFEVSDPRALAAAEALADEVGGIAAADVVTRIFRWNDCWTVDGLPSEYGPAIIIAGFEKAIANADG